MCEIDKYNRYQRNVNLADFTPNISNLCGCGCGVELTGRKTRWASTSCADKAYNYFSIIKGNVSAIRRALFLSDMGYCRLCGAYDSNWEADHIIPVFQGGGACDLSNFQTLCSSCHKEKTYNQRVGHLAAISSQAAVNASRFRLYAFGATPKFFSNRSIEMHPLLSISASL